MFPSTNSKAGRVRVRVKMSGNSQAGGGNADLAVFKMKNAGTIGIAEHFLMKMFLLPSTHRHSSKTGEPE
jgi:hypothetical protein